jgi:hypothetical protein
MYFNYKEEKIKSKNLGLIVDDMNEMLYIATQTVNNEQQLKYISNMVLTIIINIGKIKNKTMDKKDYTIFEDLVKTSYKELLEELDEDFKTKHNFIEKDYYLWLEEYYTKILEQN